MIEVELPNGDIAEFPDTMSESQIQSILVRDFGEGTLSEMGQDSPMVHEPARGEEPGFFDRAGHSLGLGTRNVLEGLGKGASLGLGDPGRVVSDWMGLAKPENDAERLRSQIIEGVTGTVPLLVTGGVASRAAAPAVKAVGKTLSESPVSQLVGGGMGNAFSEIARQSGAGEGGQLVSGLAGGAVPVGFTAAVGSVGNRLGSLINPEKLSAFRNMGYDAPTLGTISDSGVVQRIESGLSQAFPSSGVMKRAQERGQHILDSAVDQAAEELAEGRYIPPNAEQLGRFTKDAGEASRDIFRKEAGRMEEEVMAPYGGSKTQLPNVYQRIEQEANTGSPTFDFETRDRLYRQLGGMDTDARELGGTTISALRQYKRGLGDRMNAAPTVNTDTPTQGELKRLYGAAQEDLREALPEVDPQRPGVNPRREAENYFRWYGNEKQLRDDVENVFFRNKDATATARAILSADAEQLAKLESVVGSDAAKSLRAGALRELSRNNIGEFTPASVAKGIQGGKSGQEARKSIMGGGTRNLLNVAKALKDSSAMSNTSNTAGANYVTQVLAGGSPFGLAAAMGHPVAAATGAATGLAVPYGTSRLLTSPRVIKALNRWRISPNEGWQAIPSVGLNQTVQQVPSLLDLLSQYQEQE